MATSTIHIGGINRTITVNGRSLFDIEHEASKIYGRPMLPHEILSHIAESTVIQTIVLYFLLKPKTKKLDQDEVAEWLYAMPMADKLVILNEVLEQLFIGYYGKTITEITTDDPEPSNKGEVEKIETPFGDGTPSMNKP